MQLRKLEASEVEFLDAVEQELIPVEDSFDDDEAQADVERRLRSGDDSAWCVLLVQASWNGFIGRASLGGYSFPEGNTGNDNQEYAKEDFEQLHSDALEALNEQLQFQFSTLEKLAVGFDK